jgi:hypothetical protein
MHSAWIGVAVANVWASPGTATIPNDPGAWATLSYSSRIALVGHMPTQALYGERVVVLKREGGWTKIAIPDQPSPLDRRGYPGWVLSSQLRDGSGESAVVTIPKVRVGRLEVGLGSEVPPGPATRPLPVTRADLVRTAELFVGLPYLWGGLSAWGYDCSGLTWAVYRAHGITIPRDADAQYAVGRAISLDAAKPGDLIFYEHPVGHVAMLVGDGRMIEAPNSASAVRIVPIRLGDVGVRSYLP